MRTPSWALAPQVLPKRFLARHRRFNWTDLLREPPHLPGEVQE